MAVQDGLSAEDSEVLEQIQAEKEELLQEIAAMEKEIAQVQLELEELEAGVSDEEDEGSDLQVTQRRARKLFNEHAKKGVKYMIECELLDGSALSIADYLKTTEGLNKTRIGEFLGEPDELNLEVLRIFLELHDFAGMDFDQALRNYLWSFRLPGESQKIDRMMEAFAKRFCTCNPDTFSCTDTCYVLAFSVIMLNTSLHNPACKTKPTLESFISMNRGIDNGADLPKELLTEIFGSISTTQFKIPDDEEGLTYTFFNPERNGWLVKEGGSHKTWKKRWFTLVNNCLYYFETESDLNPKGTIPLENLVVREDPKKPCTFEILCEDPALESNVKAAKVKSGRFVQGKHKSYRITAENQTEMEEWIKCIRAAMMKDPLFEMFRRKREELAHH
eukprot:m.202167 g.202167  ORF g.202167 m.202167 type:complete len:390 (-) comp18435_c2_seq1:117-1286(-)